jgi:tetratricopeptide (TPR) repeat protein
VSDRRRPIRFATGIMVLAGLLIASPGGSQTLELLEAGRAAANRGDHAEAFAHFRAAYQPLEDHPMALAGMARAAAQLDDTKRFRAVLDSLVGNEEMGPNGLSYWAALSLEAGVEPIGVVDRFDVYLDRRVGEMGPFARLFRVLLGHRVHVAASALLDRALDRGVDPAAVAMLRGELELDRLNPAAALTAYLDAVGYGGATLVGAVAAIERLLETWSSSLAPEVAVARLEAAKTDADEQAAGLLGPLVVQAWIKAGDWVRAIAAADDPALGPTARGEQLRRVAVAALPVAPAAASRALDTLVDLGPPATRPADRLLSAEIARATGDHGRVAAELRAAARAGVPGANQGAWVAEVAAARVAGDFDAVERTLARARAEGIDAAALGVPFGDLWLSRQRPDSAIASYARAINEDDTTAEALEALERARLVQWLLRARVTDPFYSVLGRTMIEAPRQPAVASTRLDSLASSIGESDSLRIARSLLYGLAGEWRGRAGDATGASEMLAQAVGRSESSGEAPALLLAAGRWAAVADDTERAIALWREIVAQHATSPYALEARRLLAATNGDDGRS